MKVLVVTNFYPPYFIGGYELACYDVVSALKNKGHEILVLTSSYGLATARVEPGVWRILRAHFAFPSMVSLRDKARFLAQECCNQRAFQRACARFKPDLVYFWNLKNISLSCVFEADRRGLPYVFCVFDNGLARWKLDPWYAYWNTPARRRVSVLAAQIVRLALTAWNIIVPRGTLPVRQAHFMSDFLRAVTLAAGIRPLEEAVVYFGVDTKRFSPLSKKNRPRKILYVGQLIQHKGVHTLIEAMGILGKDGRFNDVNATIVGECAPQHRAYEDSLKQRIKELGIEQKISFRGKVARDDMPDIYRQHDIVVFPSEWEEPFGIVLVEAMASGLGVVSTSRGGSAEVVRNNENALVFTHGDASACAGCLARLLSDEDLFARLCQNARMTVEERFEFTGTIDALEKFLASAANSAQEGSSQ